jgi:hypothetical protein
MKLTTSICRATLHRLISLVNFVFTGLLLLPSLKYYVDVYILCKKCIIIYSVLKISKCVMHDEGSSIVCVNVSVRM